MARQPLAVSGYEGTVDVRIRVHGGGIGGQAGAVRHGIARALDRDRPRAPRRSEAARLPDPRRARQGAPQGRAEEGSQAAAILQALSPAPWRSACSSAPTASGARPATFLTPELAMRAGPGRVAAVDAERPQVLIIRDTRESGPMLESALAAGVAAAAATPCSAACSRLPRRPSSAAATASTWRRSSPPRTTPTRDNGIKFFGRRGDQARRRDRGADRGACSRSRRRLGPAGAVRELNGALEDYLRALRGGLPARPGRASA